MASYGKVSASELHATCPFPEGIEPQFPPRGSRAKARGEDSGESQRSVPRTPWEIAVRLTVPSLTGTDGGARVADATRAAAGSPLLLRGVSVFADSQNARPMTKAIGPCRLNLIATERVPNMG